jgi:hypothetical protein
MTLTQAFLNFCLRNSCDPCRVKIVGFSFDPKADPLPTLSMQFVKTLESQSGAAIANTTSRKHDSELKFKDGWIDTEWSKDVMSMLAYCVDNNENLFNTLCDTAITIKKYCDFKQYDFETVTIDPYNPPIMTPSDSVIKICLQVVGRVMSPDPKPLEELANAVPH